MSTVLVTGGSGFVGSHCILQLLQAGHEVRTTVRSLKREADIRAMLARGGIHDEQGLSVFEADLEADAGWSAAVEGCEYVLHVASPFPSSVPKDENELIRPAREGALRLLRASRDAAVKRVVLTSSFAAVSYGVTPTGGVFTEENWTDSSSPQAQPYPRSKTLAEQAAWDFVRAEGRGLELSVINPVGIFGPVLGPDLSSSISLIRMMLRGKVPAAPRIYFGAVDVRDVAALHLTAMTHPAAVGERFIATAGPCLSIMDVAEILHRRLGAQAAKAPKFQFPDWLFRLVGLVNSTARDSAPQLGVIRNGTSDKARRMLGWVPRSAEDSIVATAESLIALGLARA